MVANLPLDCFVSIIWRLREPLHLNHARCTVVSEISSYEILFLILVGCGSSHNLMHQIPDLSATPWVQVQVFCSKGCYTESVAGHTAEEDSGDHFLSALL